MSALTLRRFGPARPFAGEAGDLARPRQKLGNFRRLLCRNDSIHDLSHPHCSPDREQAD
jgi:hypothetical protein